MRPGPANYSKKYPVILGAGPGDLEANSQGPGSAHSLNVMG